MTFDKIVKKLLKSPSRIVSLADLADLVAPGVRDLSAGQRASVHKLAYRLKSSGVLSSVRRGLWTVVVPGSSAPCVNADELYWGMLAKAATAACGSRWLIAGRKALELHLRDVSAPDEIRVITDGPSGVSAMSPGRRLRFAPLRKYGAKGGPTLFSKFLPLRVKVAAEGVVVPVACVEHALLEYLSGPSRDRDGHLISRALAKFGATLRRDVLGQLVSLRYIVAVNRLKEAAKRLGFPSIYALCLDVIKREGRGCFVTA